VAIWPNAIMPGEQAMILDTLLSHLSFLGQDDSLCIAHRLSDAEADACRGLVNCRPLDEQRPRPGQEAVRVLCADPQTAFGDDGCADRSGGGRRHPARIAIPVFDPHWHARWKKTAEQPSSSAELPGCRWVTYLRPSDCVQIQPRRPARTKQPVAASDPVASGAMLSRPLQRLAMDCGEEAGRESMPLGRPERQGSRFTVARYALVGDALPAVEDTLPLAEQVRSRLIGLYNRLRQRQKYGDRILPDAERFASRLFTGKDRTGRPLLGHEHAYFVPTDEDGDGRLDHVTVLALATGFERDEVRALERLPQCSLLRGVPLGLALCALANEHELRAPLLAQSAVWRSATPFVATRYPKSRGRQRDDPAHCGSFLAFARHVLEEELERLRQRRPDLPPLLAVEPLATQLEAARPVSLLAFQRGRSKHSDDGGQRAAGRFRLAFAAPLRGPLCLGHGCHFGLGLFVPADSR
jgi:CRISPR-associated protein Csb2